MATNALEWLQRCPPVAALYDYPRPLPILENLKTGDVFDDGSILALNGVVMDRGFIWLAERQVPAASYYGWTRVDGTPVSHDRTTGEFLFAMQR